MSIDGAEGVEKKGQVGRYQHYIIRGRVEDLSAEFLDVCQKNSSVIKSADMQTVFEQVEGLE